MIIQNIQSESRRPDRYHRVRLDKNSDMEYQLYIQLMDNVPIEGFGMEEIVQESGAKHLEFELWDDADRSKIIFEELGIDVTDGEWQYDC